jgi:phage terminase large subunit-like protein
VKIEMGMRGINATPKRISKRPHAPALHRHPWDAPGLFRAERIIRFVNTLPCTQGPLAGTTLRLRPWQTKFIKAVYRTDKQGNRTVRTAVLSVARNNGKTQTAAALCLAHLSGPEAEMRGETYSVACTKDQAGRIFNEMVAIITRTPWLNERINVVRFRRELEDMVNGSTFRVLSADVAPVHGLSPSFVCYDELAQVPNRELYDALSTALGGRAQPLMLVISTQASSDLAPLSELVDYGLRIERGEIKDPSFHLTLYTAPPESDPWKFTTWKLANPALADFRSLEDVKRLALLAQRLPASLMSFRRYVLNQRVDASAPFLNMTLWEANSTNEYDIRDLKGRECYAGLDLGATKDMTALVLVFADGSGAFDVIPFCWLPGETLTEREDEDNMPYRLWRDEGLLLTFPGRATDPKAVAMKIAELHGLYRIRALAFDRWRIEDIKRELDAIGCNVELIPFGQGYKDLSPAVDTLERLVEQGKLRHDGHPVLKMAAANCRVEMDSAISKYLCPRQRSLECNPISARLIVGGP